MHDRIRIWSLLPFLILASCALQPRADAPRPALQGWSPATAALTAQPTALTSDDRALGHFLKGQIALNQNDYDAALGEYEAAVQEDPETPMLRLRLATLYVRKGMLDKALEQCRKVVEQDPKNTDARLLFAGLLSSTGDEAGSIAAYEKVLEFDPENQEAYLYLGALYGKQGKSERAVKTLQKLIALNPTSILGYYYLGRVNAAAQPSHAFAIDAGSRASAGKRSTPGWFAQGRFRRRARERPVARTRYPFASRRVTRRAPT